MIYQKRELRRLWKLKVFITRKDGKPPTARTKTRTETCVAWNQVDAIRQARGDVAHPPEELCYVTWDEPPLKIFDPNAGPTDQVVEPTIPLPEAW